jgi:glyoxylase-like metal-dependent hydrolase (beta-lactamase superfamily II)
MLFRQFVDLETGSFSYLLADDETHEAILIDPLPSRAERDLGLLAELGLDLRWVLLTHRHAGDPALPKLAGAAVQPGDVLRFGAHRVEVLATPGHTPDSLSYRVGRRVFTGDALLVRGCGKTDQGDPGELYDSITGVLFKLPGSTLVYPAHDPEGRTCTTIEEERRHNPVGHITRDEFVQSGFTG